MGMAADRVLDSIREFTDAIGPNNIAIGKMEIGWPGRVTMLKVSARATSCSSGLPATLLKKTRHC